MASLNIAQKIVFFFWAFYLSYLFLWSCWKRRRMTFGNVEMTIIPILIGGILIGTTTFPFSDSPYLLVFGIFFCILGFLLGNISFRHLGWVNSDDFWFARTEVKQRRLATTGPYQYIRHPIFASIISAYLGLTLVFLNYFTALLWLGALLFGILTSLKEEQFLKGQLPEYNSYIERVKWRFIPGLF